jgi:D-Tyr-tRNAtyr deacylase
MSASARTCGPPTSAQLPAVAYPAWHRSDARLHTACAGSDCSRSQRPRLLDSVEEFRVREKTKDLWPEVDRRIQGDVLAVDANTFRADGFGGPEPNWHLHTEKPQQVHLLRPDAEQLRERSVGALRSRGN